MQAKTDRKLPLLALVLTTIIVPSAYGQSSAAVEILKNQPLSVFDFGLYRIKEDLDLWVNPGKFNLPGNARLRTRVSFDPDENKIRLRFDVRTSNNHFYEITVKEKACNRIVTAIRRYFHAKEISKGVKPPSKEERWSKGIYRYFNQSGNRGAQSPDDMMEQVENLTEIRVMLVNGKNYADAFRCKAPLMGDEIDYLEAPGPFDE